MRTDAVRRTWMAFLGVTGVIAACSCGGSPQAPSEFTLTIRSPADVVRVGESIDMTLEVVFSDGRHTLITPVWGTDRPDIIDVKPLSATRQGELGEPPDQKTGVVDHMLFARITGLAPGSAMVTADSRYGSCRRAIHVIAPQ